jgi:hypothetical protein
MVEFSYAEAHLNYKNPDKEKEADFGNELEDVPEDPQRGA